jgi:hypothetical protein
MPIEQAAGVSSNQEKRFKCKRRGFFAKKKGFGRRISYWAFMSTAGCWHPRKNGRRYIV